MSRRDETQTTQAPVVSARSNSMFSTASGSSHLTKKYDYRAAAASCQLSLLHFCGPNGANILQQSFLCRIHHHVTVYFGVLLDLMDM